MKKVILLILIMLLTVAQKTISQTIGEAAPDFTVELLGGEDFTLSDHIGKVVLIFFFGNSCPYCVTSGPKVEEVYSNYIGSSDFVTVGLDTWDSSSSSGSVSSFQSSAGVSFPLAIKSGSVSSAYSMTYDRLAVIDKQGLLRHKGTTAAVNDASVVNELISDLLEEGATSTIAAKSDLRLINVYPTPASGRVYFSLQSKKQGMINLVIYDISGSEIIRNIQNVDSGFQEFSLETDNFQSGLYIYKLEFDGKLEAGKIFIR